MFLNGYGDGVILKGGKSAVDSCLKMKTANLTLFSIYRVWEQENETLVLNVFGIVLFNIILFNNVFFFPVVIFGKGHSIIAPGSAMPAEGGVP